MDDLTRRDALAYAAAAGATAWTAAQGAVPAGQQKPEAAPQEKLKTTLTDKERALDRERIIASGMTVAEADCWELLAQCAGKYFELPKLHVMDDHEISHAFHVLQYRLLGRPAYRRYLELAKAPK